MGGGGVIISLGSHYLCKGPKVFLNSENLSFSFIIGSLLLQYLVFLHS